MIAIRLVSQAGGPPTTTLEATFGDGGGDIGRAADCTLVLPDSERCISRKHLQVTCRGSSYFLRLISTNLMVELDGVPMAPGVERALEPGTQIRIGPFLLQADRQEPAANRPPTGAAEIPELFGLPGPASRPSVFHDLLHPATAALQPDTHAARPGAPLEVDVLVGGPTGTGLRVAPAAAAAAADAHRCPAATDELIGALYSGLGIPAPEPAAVAAAQLELVGALLRSYVSGTLDLLAARAIAKRELGASQTLIQARQNNPLKFSPDANVALARLLEPPRRGFVSPVAAVREAFDDLRAHEIAVMAGMRAALAAVLDRLSPATLALGLSDKGLWDNLLPANHKAKLWERYSEQHAELAREIEENVDAHVAGAFNDAYEAQLARLSRE